MFLFLGFHYLLVFAMPLKKFLDKEGEKKGFSPKKLLAAGASMKALLAAGFSRKEINDSVLNKKSKVEEEERDI